jgi:hypothetical protein
MGERNRFYDRELHNEAIDRIVDATGLNCSIADREELSIDLPMARAICVSLERAYSHSARKRQTAKLKTMIKLAEELQRCLTDSEIGREVLMQPNIKQANPRKDLKHLASAARALLPDNQPSLIEERFVKLIQHRSEFENLAGQALPNVFELRFHRTPKISRNAEQQPGGPFIRFAYQALIELEFTKNGKPYSHEAIARAKGIGHNAVGCDAAVGREAVVGSRSKQTGIGTAHVVVSVIWSAAVDYSRISPVNVQSCFLRRTVH